MPFTKEERAKQKAERFRAEAAEGNNENEGENVLYQDEAAVNDNAAGMSERLRPCCVPFGCTVGKPVNIADPDDVEKVVCNNADCVHGEYMHKSCFLAWEEEVLTYLRSSGRARSWSEKQRRQNLWTKKGYDLAWKACSCQCAKGHLRKDLDWIPPKRLVPENEDNAQRKHRRRKKSSDKPSIGKATTLPPNPHGGSGHGRHRHTSASSNENHTPPQSPVVRSDSTSSLTQSPRTCTNHQQNQCKHHIVTNKQRTFDWPLPQHGVSCSDGGGDTSLHIPVSKTGISSDVLSGLIKGQQFSTSQHSQENTEKNTSSEQFTEHVLPAHSKSEVGLVNHEVPFIHRMDLSIFSKLLPPEKCNPYHIRMENDQASDTDEVRGYVLSTLAAHGVTTMICSLCQNQLPVFDCHPLIDGTFYLTPLNHSDASLRLTLNGRVQYLGAVCMQCLEGIKRIVCRICNSRWDGSHHQLGTLYSYDIFAASPCCPGRVSCKKCGKPVTDPTRGTHFFSEYSQNIPCPHCGVPDFHFVKPLSSYEVLCHEVDIRH